MYKILYIEMPKGRSSGMRAQSLYGGTSLKNLRTYSGQKQVLVRRNYPKNLQKMRRRQAKYYDRMIHKGIGVPNEFFTKMKYVEVIQMTAGVGAAYQTYQFRGNSLFDPNLTGTGVQCQYFDQICGANALYNRYLVLGSKIKLRLCSSSDAFAAGNADFVVTPSQELFSSVGWVDIDDQISEHQSKTTSIVRYDNAGPKYLSHYGKTKDVVDVKDLKDNLATCAALYNANPTASWYWILGMQGMDRSSTTATVNVKVEITYFTMFYDTVQPAQS